MVLFVLLVYRADNSLFISAFTISFFTLTGKQF